SWIRRERRATPRLLCAMARCRRAGGARGLGKPPAAQVARKVSASRDDPSDACLCRRSSRFAPAGAAGDRRRTVRPGVRSRDRQRGLLAAQRSGLGFAGDGACRPARTLRRARDESAGGRFSRRHAAVSAAYHVAAACDVPGTGLAAERADPVAGGAVRAGAVADFVAGIELHRDRKLAVALKAAPQAAFCSIGSSTLASSPPPSRGSSLTSPP